MIKVYVKVKYDKYLGMEGVLIVDVVSSDTCDEDREKYSDTRSISKMNTMR
jgi:hypothetical protein